MIKLKAKDLNSPWITRSIKKSSKGKHRIYEKLLKYRPRKMSLNIKITKNFWNQLKDFQKTTLS